MKVQSFSHAIIEHIPHSTVFTRFLLSSLPNLLALCLLFVLAQRAYTTFDFSWDAGAYHLPFAARIAGIFPESEFRFAPDMEERFLGFPLLGNALQGLFWRITDNPNTTNFVNFSGLLACVLFSTYRLKLKFWQVCLFMLSIPVAVIHSTLSYMDMFPNALIVIGIVSLLYSIEHDNFGLGQFAGIIFPFTLATNTKFQALFPALLFTAITIVLFGWKRRHDLINKGYPSKTFLMFVLASFALASIGSFTYAKNWYQHDNPFYPFERNFGPIHFEGPERELDTKMRIVLPPALRDKSAPELFLISALELNIWTENAGLLWRIDGPSVTSAYSPAFKTGGFFVANVILWVSVLVVLNLSDQTPKLRIYSLLVLISIVANSLFPFSHYARYWIYLPLFLGIVVLQVLKQYSSVQKTLYRLVLTLQIFLLLFVWYQIDPFIKPISREPAFAYFERILADETAPSLCVYGPEWYFGIVVKIAKPELIIENARTEEQCTVPNTLLVGGN